LNIDFEVIHELFFEDRFHSPRSVSAMSKPRISKQVIFAGKATSDPYVVGTISGQHRIRSSTVMKTLNPVWPSTEKKAETISLSASRKHRQPQNTQASSTAAATDHPSSSLSSQGGEVLYDQVPLPANFKDEQELLFTVKLNSWLQPIFASLVVSTTGIGLHLAPIVKLLTFFSYNMC